MSDLSGFLDSSEARRIQTAMFENPESRKDAPGGVLKMDSGWTPKVMYGRLSWLYLFEGFGRAAGI